MSLYKRGNVWWYKFKFSGQSIRESTHSTRRDVARDAERTRRREIELAINGVERRDPAPLFKFAVETWLASKAGKAAKTITGYEQRTKPLRAAFGDRLICDIRRQDVLSYRAERLREEKPPSPRTINYEVGCLRAILEEHGRFVRIKRSERLRENSDVGKAVSYEQEQALLTECINSMSPALYPLFTLAIDTGLRAAEIKALRRRDLVLTWQDGAIAAGEVIVPKSKTEAARIDQIGSEERGELNLSEILLQQVQFHQDQAAQKEISLTVGQVDQRLLLRGDPYHLREAVANLLSNAISTPRAAAV